MQWIQLSVPENVSGKSFRSSLAATGSRIKNFFSRVGFRKERNPMATNNSMAGMAGGMLTGLAQAGSGTYTTGIGYPGQLIYPGGYATTTEATYPGFNPSPFPVTSVPTVGHFRIQRIDNGFLIEIARRVGEQVETHYAEDFKAAGELICAMCVRWELEGNKP